MSTDAQTVLFLCPHNAAKSVMAAAYFNQLAQERGLPFRADSAGTEPSDSVSPVVTAMLSEDGIDASGHQPRHVTPDELQNAARAISIGCTAEELGMAQGVEYWDDVPMVSQNPEGARQAIRSHIQQLVAELGEIR
jgi:arsenate reductase (thioredoxin)